MHSIENEFPRKYLRHSNLIGYGLPPTLSLFTWAIISYAASRNPGSFLAENDWLTYVLSAGPLLAWVYSWKATHVTLGRWPSTIGVGEEGIVAEFRLLEERTERFLWEDIMDVSIHEQPLGWGPVGYLILSDGSHFMEMEVWGEAALELKRHVKGFKAGSRGPNIEVQA